MPLFPSYDKCFLKKSYRYAGIGICCAEIVFLAIAKDVFSECWSILVNMRYSLPPNCTPDLLLLGDILASIVGSILALIGFIVAFIGALSRREHKLEIATSIQV